MPPWIRARRPVDLLGLEPRSPEPRIDDAVVRVAVEHLTHAVNLSSGLSHPSDKAHAVETFRALHSGGHRWDPATLRAWALAHGWSGRGADDLRKYADGIQSGRSFRTAEYRLRDDVLEQWQQEASGGDG